jgi:8-oxo-dGTP diphosphatase
MKERVRAIIINNDKIILIKRVKSEGVYFVFPGGGVEDGENKTEALLREVREELGLDVVIRELVSSLRLDKDKFEQIEYFYLCDVISGTLGTGDGPEFQNNSSYEGSHEVLEISIANLKELNLFPLEIRDLVFERFISEKYDN